MTKALEAARRIIDWNQRAPPSAAVIVVVTAKLLADASEVARALLERDAPMREALEAAYTYITQPRRMTRTEATYDIRNYNKLTEKIRTALEVK